ncbi:class I SAM-dependent methyltransferase [Candidatus Latescibacterota bacterium]
MKPLKDRDLATFFDECAHNGYMASFLPEDEPKVEELIQRWAITPGSRVLEPGCGSGRLTDRLSAAVGTDGAVYATDLSPEMIRCARERKLPEQVRLFQGSAERIQADDGFFDMAILFCVFPHFSNQARTLDEINRVLKPNGSLWINHLKDSRTLNETHRDVSKITIAHHLAGIDEMKNLLSEHGFTVTEFLDSLETGYSVSAEKY